MEFFNSLNLKQIKGGTKLKQGDLGSVLSYSLTDENGQEITSFDKKTAYINLVLDDKIWFTTTTLVDISRVTFRIDKAIPIGLYYLEIKIDDYIFPSDRDSIILIEEGSTPYDLKELVPNYDINMTIKGILSDLSQKGIDISDLNRRIGNANAELIASRNGKPNLKTRIDDLENKTTAQLAQKANKDEVTNVMTPKGNIAYASLPTSGNQVGWYYYCPDGVHGAGNYVWNGKSWFFGGTGDEGYNLLKKELDNLPIEMNCQYLKLSDLDAGKYYNWYSGSPSMSIVAHDAYSIYKTPVPVKSGQTINYKNIDMAFTVVTTIGNELIGKLNTLTGDMSGTGTYTVEQDCLVYVTHKNDNEPAMLTVDFEIPNKYIEGVISATFAPMSRKMLEMIKTGIGYNSSHVITVKKDGSGDYTSVVDAVNYANSLGTGADIYVYDGVYDILAELGGNTFLASVSHNGTFAERQGLRLSDNVNLYGVGRVIFNYLLPDTVTYVQSQCTSCINLYASNRIENIEFYAKNCRYACHDEANGGNPYLKRYVKNCRFVHYGNVDGLWKYPTVLGGGAGGGSQYDWVNCQFITTAYNQAFSYHTNYNQKPSKFNVDGCVGICMSETGNSFRCSYHGTGQVGKTIFNFKNCSGNGRVIKQAETSGSTDHIEMYNNGYVQITDISAYT